MSKIKKIKRDEVGLYLQCQGVVRPVGSTQFKEGDKVTAGPRKCTFRVGVGKDKTCGRGQYLEEWTSTGAMKYSHRSVQEHADAYRWYKHEFCRTYGATLGIDPAVCQEAKLTQAEWAELLQKITGRWNQKE